MTVYISIGNSDDQLSHSEWSDYIAAVASALRASSTQIHGSWYSAPQSRYQNACRCAEIAPDRVESLQRHLASLARLYGQDSIAWAAAPETLFIGSGL